MYNSLGINKKTKNKNNFRSFRLPVSILIANTYCILRSFIAYIRDHGKKNILKESLAASLPKPAYSFPHLIHDVLIGEKKRRERGTTRELNSLYCITDASI